jgi:nucleoside-diphosphate-sugar epimerase
MRIQGKSMAVMHDQFQTRKSRKPRLTIIGCGDIGMRVIRLLRGRFRIFAVTRQAERIDALRAAGAIPIVADLDRPASLVRVARLASFVIHLAPPQSDGITDRRTRHLAAILPAHASLVYMSTTGVYGDCGGALVDETRALDPQNARAMRRVDAEQTLRSWARRSGARLSILRVPGIYAAERLPIERLTKGIPALREEDDVFTNHIHADDLAHIVVLALTRGAPCRAYHAVDDSCMKMGEYFDAVAQEFNLPKAQRLPRAELKSQVSPMLWSFMTESRRLTNLRIKCELGATLRYPHVTDALPFMHMKDA